MGENKRYRRECGFILEVELYFLGHLALYVDLVFIRQVSCIVILVDLVFVLVKILLSLYGCIDCLKHLAYSNSLGMVDLEHSLQQSDK